MSFRDAGSLQLPSALNLALLASRHGLGVGGGLLSWVGFFPSSEPFKSEKGFFKAELTLGNATIGRIC